MIGPNDITAGRTTIETLLLVAVLTAATVGTTGIATAEVIDGKGNDVLTGTTTDDIVFAFPIDNVTGVTFAFPINNATDVSFQTLPVGQLPVETSALADVPSLLTDAFVAVIWSQDMDPY